jgi:hypothetical protein
VSDEREVQPQVPDADMDGDGRGVWHNDTEMRRLLRPMTELELEDMHSYDRSLYRMRHMSLARLRALHGNGWMLFPCEANRA